MATLLPINIMLNQRFIDRRGTAVSIALMGLSIEGTLFIPLLTALIQAVGWRLTYILCAVLILVVCLPIQVKVFAFKPEDKGFNPYREAKPSPK